MKALFTVSLVTLTISLQALAVSPSEAADCRAGYGFACLGACAPEVEHGNIIATDKALSALAKTDLKDAAKFNALVNKAQTLPESQRRQAYLNLAGVQSDSDIVEFMSSREIDQKFIRSLSQNADLNDSQAKLVIEKISKSLLGERK